MKIEISEQEAQAIISALDNDVRSKGLAVANEALLLVAKIQAAAKAVEVKDEKPKK